MACAPPPKQTTPLKKKKRKLMHLRLLLLNQFQLYLSDGFFSVH